MLGLFPQSATDGFLTRVLRGFVTACRGDEGRDGPRAGRAPWVAGSPGAVLSPSQQGLPEFRLFVLLMSVCS